jgi:hypothetical protein
MCPTIEPAVIATIIGCMAWIIGPSMAPSWSSSPNAGARSGSLSSASAVTSGEPNDPASFSSSGR